MFTRYVPVSDTGPRSLLTQLPFPAAVRNALLGSAQSPDMIKLFTHCCSWLFKTILSFISIKLQLFFYRCFSRSIRTGNLEVPNLRTSLFWSSAFNKVPLNFYSQFLKWFENQIKPDILSYKEWLFPSHRMIIFSENELMEFSPKD